MIPPGLCDSCIHARAITSSRGSTFIRCELSFTDPRFPKYPPLPVVRCEGYEPDPSRPRGSSGGLTKVSNSDTKA